MSEANPMLRFGSFELDLEEEELRKRGALIKIQAQPLKILALLAGQAGELVSRKEIRHHVWGAGTFVDYDQGINVCVRQIRQVLGDHAASPRFVETVPRRGYRFLAPVEWSGEVAPDPPLRLDRRLAPRVATLAATMLVLVVSVLVVGTLVAGRERQAASAPSVGMISLSRFAPAPGGVLAILPLESYSSRQEDEFLSDGLTEELITEISRRYGGRLDVIARTSALKYKGSLLSVREIAAELGADYVLEGSVRRSGDRLRITAQLIRAIDEVHLWAGNYDRELSDAIVLQSEVSAKIGQALALELQLEVLDEPPGIAATQPLAYEAYLRGRHELAPLRSGGFLPEGALNRAQRHLERALELDPGFAPAWVEIGTIHRMSQPSPTGARRAELAFERALALDDSNPRAHHRMAMLRLYHDWDLEAARASFERALDLNPGFAQAHHDLAAYYSVNGRHEEAVASVRRALRLDPRSPGVASDVGWYFYFSRRFGEAIEYSWRTLEIEPGYFWAHRCILLAAIADGNLETARMQALADMRRLDAEADDLRLVAADSADEALTAYWRWRVGRFQAADGGFSIPAAEVATLHMALGQDDLALDFLERAYNERRGWILPFLPVFPLFDPLRSEPRFITLLEGVG